MIRGDRSANENQFRCLRDMKYSSLCRLYYHDILKVCSKYKIKKDRTKVLNFVFKLFLIFNLSEFSSKSSASKPNETVEQKFERLQEFPRNHRISFDEPIQVNFHEFHNPIEASHSNLSQTIEQFVNNQEQSHHKIDSNFNLNRTETSPKHFELAPRWSTAISEVSPPPNLVPSTSTVLPNPSKFRQSSGIQFDDDDDLDETTEGFRKLPGKENFKSLDESNTSETIDAGSIGLNRPELSLERANQVLKENLVLLDLLQQLKQLRDGNRTISSAVANGQQYSPANKTLISLKQSPQHMRGLLPEGALLVRHPLKSRFAPAKFATQKYAANENKLMRIDSDDPQHLKSIKLGEEAELEKEEKKVGLFLEKNPFVIPESIYGRLSPMSPNGSNLFKAEDSSSLSRSRQSSGNSNLKGHKQQGTALLGKRAKNVVLVGNKGKTRYIRKQLNLHPFSATNSDNNNLKAGTNNNILTVSNRDSVLSDQDDSKSFSFSASIGAYDSNLNNHLDRKSSLLDDNKDQSEDDFNREQLIKQFYLFDGDTKIAAESARPHLVTPDELLATGNNNINDNDKFSIDGNYLNDYDSNVDSENNEENNEFNSIISGFNSNNNGPQENEYNQLELSQVDYNPPKSNSRFANVGRANRLRDRDKQQAKLISQSLRQTQNQLRRLPAPIALQSAAGLGVASGKFRADQPRGGGDFKRHRNARIKHRYPLAKVSAVHGGIGGRGEPDYRDNDFGLSLNPISSSSDEFETSDNLNNRLISTSPSHQVVHIHHQSHHGKKKDHGKYLWPIVGGGLTMLMGFLIISNILLSIPLLAIGASSLFHNPTNTFRTQQLVPVYNLSRLPTTSGRRRRRRRRARRSFFYPAVAATKTSLRSRDNKGSRTGLVRLRDEQRQLARSIKQIEGRRQFGLLTSTSQPTKFAPARDTSSLVVDDKSGATNQSRQQVAPVNKISSSASKRGIALTAPTGTNYTVVGKLAPRVEDLEAQVERLIELIVARIKVFADAFATSAGDKENNYRQLLNNGVNWFGGYFGFGNGLSRRQVLKAAYCYKPMSREQQQQQQQIPVLTI